MIGSSRQLVLAVVVFEVAFWRVFAAEHTLAKQETVSAHMEDTNRSEEHPDQTLAAMLQKFRQDSIRVLFFARRSVSLNPASRVELEHLVFGIIHVEPVAISSHIHADWTIERLESVLNLSGGDMPILPEDADVPFSAAVVACLRRAVRLADDLHNLQVVPRHLLVALLEDESASVVKVLRDAGINRESIMESLRRQP